MASFATDSVSCVGPQGDRLSLKRIVDAEGKLKYFVNIDEALSSQFVGRVVNRVLVQNQTTKADVFYDWDGNSGVKLLFRKGFLKSEKGGVSLALLKVEYNDIAKEVVSHKLNCTAE